MSSKYLFSFYLRARAVLICQFLDLLRRDKYHITGSQSTYSQLLNQLSPPSGLRPEVIRPHSMGLHDVTQVFNR